MRQKFYFILLFTYTIFTFSISSFGQELKGRTSVPDLVKADTVTTCCSTQIIKGNNLLPPTASDFNALLDGNFTGVEQANGNGQPESIGYIRIRGTHNLTGAGGMPLIVLDSMPYQGSLNSINLHDIASINVLKDGRAAALYGIEALDGVIFINTKNTTDAKFHLNLDAGLGMTTQAFSNYETIRDDQDFYEFTWGQLRNYYYRQGKDLSESAQMASNYLFGNIIGSGYNAYDVPNKELIDPTTGKINPNAQLKYPAEDWRKAMRQPALRQDYHLSGGKKSEKGSYYFGLGYLNDDGFVKNTGFERFSVRFNGTFQPFKWLKAGLLASGGQIIQNIPTLLDRTFYYANILPPIYPVYYRDADGNKVTDADGHYIYDMANGVKPDESMGFRHLLPNFNLIQELESSTFQTNSKAIWARPYLSIAFLKHFDISSKLNYHISDDDIITESPSHKFRAESSDLNTKMHDATWCSVLSWSQGFGQHRFKASIGYELLNNYRKYWNVINQDTIQRGMNQTFFEGYFAQLNYTFKEKYTFYGAFRRDGTTLLPPENRYVNSWAAGVIWHIKQEPFLQTVRFLTDWTLSANYGASHHKGGSNLMGNFSDAPRSFDLGTNLSFVNNRIGLDAHYFVRNDENLGYNFIGSPGTGLPGRYYDGVTLRTRGLELALNTTPVVKRHFSWNMALSLSHYKGVIRDMGTFRNAYHLNNGMILEKGLPVNSFYLPRSLGVDPVNGDELYSYTTANGTILSTNDYVVASANGCQYLGNAAPDWFGGLSNSFTYHRFRLFVQLTFGLGGNIYDLGYQELMSGWLGQNYSTDILKAWTPENKNTGVPRVDMSAANNAQPSSRFISSASYLNVHEFSLSYDFSTEVAAKMKLSEFRIYVSANNLMLLSARKGLNPQATFSGVSDFHYPDARTIMLGIHVGL